MLIGWTGGANFLSKSHNLVPRVYLAKNQCFWREEERSWERGCKSQSVVKQNQSNSAITFDTQLKAALACNTKEVNMLLDDPTIKRTIVFNLHWAFHCLLQRGTQEGAMSPGPHTLSSQGSKHLVVLQHVIDKWAHDCCYIWLPRWVAMVTRGTSDS